VNLWCWLFGHRPFRLPGWKRTDHFLTMHDGPKTQDEPKGHPVAFLDLCERCHTVYWRGADDR